MLIAEKKNLARAQKPGGHSCSTTGIAQAPAPARRRSELQILHEDELAYAPMIREHTAGASAAAAGVVDGCACGSTFKNGETVLAWWKDKWLLALVKKQCLERSQLRYEVQQPNDKFSAWQVGSGGIKRWRGCFPASAPGASGRPPAKRRKASAGGASTKQWWR